MKIFPRQLRKFKLSRVSYWFYWPSICTVAHLSFALESESVLDWSEQSEGKEKKVSLFRTQQLNFWFLSSLRLGSCYFMYSFFSTMNTKRWWCGKDTKACGGKGLVSWTWRWRRDLIRITITLAAVVNLPCLGTQQLCEECVCLSNSLICANPLSYYC